MNTFDKVVVEEKGQCNNTITEGYSPPELSVGKTCNKKRINNVEMLPNEMLEFILSYLPPYRDLENCSLVCKRWQNIVKNLIRRSKMNLCKGLVDFRLRWELSTPQISSNALESIKTFGISNSCTNMCNTSASIIAGRFSHSAVRQGNSMYVFGGVSSSDTTFNDLWRFDLSEMRWERPLSMGSYPSPKGSASMVCWRDQLVLFGGWRYPSLHPPYQPWCLFDELHYYDLNTNRWILALGMSSPPPMAGHSASIHGDIMVVFGGYQMIDGVNSNSNETWCLDLSKQHWWQPRFVKNIKPPPRYGQFQLVLDERHLLIVGGCGGPNSVYSDAWLLDMTHELWLWKPIPVRNKKYAASHMWCNPACKVNSKLVVLGATPNAPQDFQLMKQTRAPLGAVGAAGVLGPAHNNRNILERAQFPDRMNEDIPAPIRNQNRVDYMRGGVLGGGALGHMPGEGPGDYYIAQRRAILNNYQQNVRNNNFIRQYNYNNNPRTGSLKDLHVASYRPSNNQEEKNHNCVLPSTSTGLVSHYSKPNLNDKNPSFDVPSTSERGNSIPRINPEQEAAHRLQRNLALRCRENEPLLPKRFDELYEDSFRMAAFNVQKRPRSLSMDHSERIRRMEEKMNALRNSRRSAAVAEPQLVKEPSPKRVKRNVVSLFVCDLSHVLPIEGESYLEWLEYKNYGILPGAPERLILSTMVAGHGELILFGGVHKESLSEITHQVSNSVYFLRAPRDIV